MRTLLPPQFCQLKQGWGTDFVYKGLISNSLWPYPTWSMVKNAGSHRFVSIWWPMRFLNLGFNQHEQRVCEKDVHQPDWLKSFGSLYWSSSEDLRQFGDVNCWAVFSTSIDHLLDGYLLLRFRTPEKNTIVTCFLQSRRRHCRMELKHPYGARQLSESMSGSVI